MRTILHVDMNNFYASVECLYTPALRGRPVAVVGDAERRHGIVLAKSYAAKACGVATGDPIWMARQKCPDIVLVPPRYDRYLHHSRLAREIYAAYTDRVEPYGLDECWLDVTGSAALYGDGRAIADELRRRVREELGITASVGVSFNKVFAKLGSDFQKPDATTVLSPEGWREIVWPRPVEELLYVGPQTARTLKRHGIRTIGELAAAWPPLLWSTLGKCGAALQRYAQGQDSAPVALLGETPPPQSIGNSTTLPRDLEDGDGLRIVLYILCESVAERLREQGLQCRTVQVSLRDRNLLWRERQTPLPFPASSAQTLYESVYPLVLAQIRGPLRSVGVRACQLDHWAHSQTSLFPEEQRSQKRDDLERAVDAIRRRFGRDSVRRGLLLTDPSLAAFSPLTDHPAAPPGGAHA